MHTLQRWLLLGVAAGALAGMPARAQDPPPGDDGGVSRPAPGGEKERKSRKKKPRGTLEAARAGWLLGMYIGEGEGSPYPFVLQLDEKSEAKQKGIRTGDELLKIDEIPSRPFNYLYRKVSEYRPGRYVSIWVRRGVQNHLFELRVPKPQTAASPGAEAAKAGDGSANPEGAKAPEKKAKKKRPPVIFKPIPPDQQ